MYQADFRDLIHVLYQPDSPYDIYVKARTAAGLVPEANEDGIPKGDPIANSFPAPDALCLGGLRLPNNTRDCNATVEDF